MANLGRSNARAIDSEKHVLKHTYPFTNKLIDYSILYNKNEKAMKKTIDLIYPDYYYYYHQKMLPDKKNTHLMFDVPHFLILAESCMYIHLDFYIFRKMIELK